MYELRLSHMIPTSFELRLFLVSFLFLLFVNWLILRWFYLEFD